MDSNLKTEKIKGILGLIVVVFGIIGFAILIITRSSKIKQVKKDGVFVLGKFTSSTSWKNGMAFDFTYIYDGKVYETSLVDDANKYKEGDLIFVRISTSDPSKCMRGNYPRPGPCIAFETAPPEGWKEIPTCK